MAQRDQLADGDPALGSVDPRLHPPRAFAEADWAWFLARSAALGIPEAGPRRPALEALYGHLVGVNRWLNLTTLTAPRDYLKWHVLDSLALVGDRRLAHLADGAPCLDLGSGGGYPGLPLALWHPRSTWVLADARRKKAEFLAAAAPLAGPRVSACQLSGSHASHQARELHRSCQLVVSRAMGGAAAVLRESSELLQRSGHVVVYKGPAYDGRERAEAAEAAAGLGLRAVSERRVRLEDGDPERILAIFVRER